MAAAGVRLGGTLLIKPATPRTNMLPACHIALFNPIHIYLYKYTYQHIYYIGYIHQVDNCNIYKNQNKAGKPLNQYDPCLHCIELFNPISVYVLKYRDILIMKSADILCRICLIQYIFINIYYIANIYQHIYLGNKTENAMA